MIASITSPKFYQIDNTKCNSEFNSNSEHQKGQQLYAKGREKPKINTSLEQSQQIIVMVCKRNWDIEQGKLLHHMKFDEKQSFLYM